MIPLKSFSLILLLCILSKHDVLSAQDEPSVMIHSTSFGTSATSLGHITIGGLFSIHRNYNPLSEKCYQLDLQELINVQGMIFAIERINNDSELLPNVTLGYEIRDMCGNPKLAVTQTLDLIFQIEQYDNYNTYLTTECHCIQTCQGVVQDVLPMTQILYNSGVGGMIGATGYVESTDVSTILKSLDLPLVSYSTTESIFGDRDKFPIFFRTVPADHIRADIAFSIVNYFHWHFISIVRTDDTYGRDLKERFLGLTARTSACIDVNLIFGKTANVTVVISSIKSSAAPVVVLLMNQENLIKILRELEAQNVTGKTLLTSSSWPRNITTIKKEIVGGMIGSSLNILPSDQFMIYLRKLLLCKSLNPWLLQFWFARNGNDNLTSSHVKDFCSQYANVTIEDFHHDITTLTSHVAYVVDAVYALAHSIHKTLNCAKDHCHIPSNIKEFKIKLHKLIENMYQVSFPAMSSKEFEFNPNGGPVYKHYHIISLRQMAEGLKIINIGNFSDDRHEHMKNRLYINDSMVAFGPYSNVSKLPIFCDQHCQAGTYYKLVHNRVCCWQCFPCSNNTMSNDTNSQSCIACPLGTKADASRRKCKEIEPYILSYSSVQSIVMLIIDGLAVACTLFFWVVIIIYRHTPVVKASDFLLTQMLLLAILMCLSVGPLFSAPVSALNCTAALYLFCVSIAFAMSIILAKTNRISRIFKEGMVKANKLHKVLLNRGQAVIVIILTIIEIAICTISTILDPILITREVKSQELVYLQCRSKSRIGFVFAVGYFALLSIICMYFAFKTRKLPENFCEAKYICFSSAIMFLSIVTMVPAYFGTSGPFQAAISSFGIIAFAISILGCMFGKKIYIILYEPHNNTKEKVMLTVAAYTFNRASEPGLSSQDGIRINSKDGNMIVFASPTPPNGRRTSNNFELSRSVCDTGDEFSSNASLQVPVMNLNYQSDS